MGRREVIELECDRCGRVQTQGKSEVFDGEGGEFSFTFRGKTVTYTDLCKTCRGTITNYVDRISKVTPGEKPTATKDKKGGKSKGAAKSGAQAAPAS